MSEGEIADDEAGAAAGGWHPSKPERLTAD